MKFATKSVLVAATLSLGLAAAPVKAQVGGYADGYDRTSDIGTRPSGVAPGYDEFGRLNVWGARLQPRGSNGLVGGLGSAVGGVVGGVGNVVGGTVGGVTGAADDLVTGSIGRRDGTAYRAR